MAVVVAGQGVVSLALGGVGCLFQASEQSVMNRVFLGAADRLLQDALKLEPALRLLEDQSQAMNELREFGELEQLRVWMSSAQESDVLLRQAGCHGLVSRQHELFDDLMALVVDGQMRAGDLTAVAKLDPDLRKRELERAAANRRRRSEHRQLEHFAEHRGGRGGDARMVLARAAS